MRALGSATLALLCLPALASVVGKKPIIEEAGFMAHAPLREISGIVRSERWPDVFWVHNDSGDRARIFAVDAAGDVVFPPSLSDRYHGETAVPGRKAWPGIPIANATHIDWEDIALDKGRLVIADVGNNDNARRDLGIYLVDEPDPRKDLEIRALRFLPVRYPEQKGFPPTGPWVYDCEAVFVADGRIHLLTRHRPHGMPQPFVNGVRLYRLDTEFTDHDNVLTLVDERDDLRAAGGADLSPDGRKLAVVTYRALWVFERPEDGERWLSGPARRLALNPPRTKQTEAVCWEDDATLRIANEQREMFRIPLSALERIQPSRE